MVVKLKGAMNQVRSLRFLPEDIEFKISSPTDILLDMKASLTLTMLIARVKDHNVSIHGFDWNALKAVCYGSGFTNYQTASDTAPIAFSAAYELEADNGLFHRFDLTIAVQTAEIRFYLDDSNTWGDAIPIPIGVSSLEFSTSKVQVKYESVAGTTYTIVGYN